MLAAVDHEAVIFGGQGGIESAGLIGTDEQGFAQKVIATLSLDPWIDVVEVFRD